MKKAFSSLMHSLKNPTNVAIGYSIGAEAMQDEG